MSKLISRSCSQRQTMFDKVRYCNLYKYIHFLFFFVWIYFIVYWNTIYSTTAAISLKYVPCWYMWHNSCSIWKSWIENSIKKKSIWTKVEWSSRDYTQQQNWVTLNFVTIHYFKTVEQHLSSKWFGFKSGNMNRDFGSSIKV